MYLIKVAADGILRHRLELFQALRLSKDAMIKSLSCEPVFRVFFNQKYYFRIHAALPLQDCTMFIFLRRLPYPDGFNPPRAC